MPITGQQVDPNSVPAASALNPTVSRHLFAMSDGARLAVWQGANGAQYAVRSTGGAWGAPVQFATPAGGLNPYYGLGQNGNVVSLFANNTSATVNQIKLSYAAGAVTMSTASYSGFNDVLTSIDVLYNTTLSAWIIAGGDNLTSGVAVYQIQESSSTAGQGVTLSGISGASRVHLTSSGPASNVLYLSYQQSGSSLFVAPVTIAGTTISIGTPETAYPGCTDYSAEIDANGNLDLVVLDERSSGTHSIVAVKRLGVNSYNSPTILYNNTQGSTPPVTSYDSATGNLTVYVQSLANQSNGELLRILRSGGSWGGAQLAVGGDGNGYGSPSTNRYAVSGTSEWLYLSGTSTTLLQYSGFSNGSTPTVPVPVSPSGNITTLLPTFIWNSANPTPSDAPQARELLIQRVSDGVTMWDTGRMTTGDNHSIVYSTTATGLAYGVQYRWQVREWDTVLNSPSAYSSPVTFTVTRPGTVAITNVAANGLNVAAGGDITGANCTLSYSWSHPDGLSNTQYQGLLYADDGVTLVNAQQTATYANPLSSGSTTTVHYWTITDGANPPISNLTYYRFQIQATDSQGGVTLSPQYRVRTNWPPPAPVTGFSALSNPVTGTVRLSWQLPPGMTGINVYTRRSPLPGHIPDPWVQFQGVGLVTHLTVYPLLLTRTDYAIQTIDTSGVIGTLEVLPNVLLPLLFGRSYTAWITDTANPSTSVPVGLANDAGGASTWQHVTGPVSMLYEGHTMPTVDYLPTSYYTATGRKYVVFALDTDNATRLAWRDIRAALTAMDGGNSVLYRDMDNHAFICTLTNFSEGQADAVSYNVSFDLIQTTTTLNPLALWSA